MAARWTEVTLVNRTSNNLRKTGDHLDHGVWDNDPPPLLVGDRAVWASESDGVLTGTVGTVTFQIETVEPDGQRPEVLGRVTLHWDNPFAGGNSYDASVLPQATPTGPGFSVGFFGGGGDDARVTFVLSNGLVEVDRETGALTGTQAQASTPAPAAPPVTGTEHYAAVWTRGGPAAWQARHGLTAAQYQQTFDELVNQGYRLTHVSGYTVDGQDRYAAIWVQADGPAWQARHGLSAQQYQQTFDELLGQGFRPVHVSGYTVDGQDRYAAIWVADGAPFQARHGLTAQQYQQTFDELVNQGFRLTHVSGYTVDGQDRYAALWEPGPGPAWQARHGLTAAQYQQTFDQLLAQGFRPVHVSGYTVNGEDRYAALFVQDGAPFQARHGLTGAQYQQTFDQLLRDGFALTCVTGYGA
jgi:hypothetical protein